MRLLDLISEGMFSSDAAGRRVFCHGPALLARRCVYVAPVQERQLRRIVGVAVVLFGMAVAGSAAVASLWVRIAIGAPLWAIALEMTLRRSTSGLSAAPVPVRRPQRDVATSLARSTGATLLWGQLILFAGLTVLSLSPLVSYEELGWQKYGALVAGLWGVAYSGYQLVILRSPR